LRDICTCLKAHKNKLYRLGIKQFVNHSTLSRANQNRDWRIFADFGAYLIQLVKPLYENQPISNVDIEIDVLAQDSTTISLSLKLFTWAKGKYSRGALKVHTLLDLRGNIPTYILITDGRYHDSKVLDVMPIQPDAIYVMDKAYVEVLLRSIISIMPELSLLPGQRLHWIALLLTRISILMKAPD